MTEQQIYERLRPIFCEVFDDDISPRPDMTAADVETWDSLSNIRLIVAVEEAFGLKFSTIEITGFQNVGDFVSSIKAKLASH